jgi:3-deoxy-D-manno-octulosonic-acid transferase
MYLIYSMLFSVGAILTAPFYWWRKGRGQGRGYWAERFGNIPYLETVPGAIWIHAVSLGETLAVAGLIKEMERKFPRRKIYLSHVTPTGREAGEKRLPSIAGRFYLPLDWRWAARKVMGRIRPALLVIVETELWPNLLRAAQEAGARVVMVNARLSKRSLRGYELARPFMRRVLADVDEICAQTEDDAERFRQLGAPPERVRMVGNLKFDAQPPKLGEFARALKVALRQTQRGPVVVAASTMPGEEAQVLEAWDLIRGRYPKALLILAPRHPERFDEVSRDLTRAQRGFVRRTALKIAGPIVVPAAGVNQNSEEQESRRQLDSASILLLDTIGELAGVFEVADMVFIGGSLVPTGGHNLIEPAYFSKVIAFGPHMENFRDIAGLFLDAGAALQVRSPEELAHAAWLLENKEAREELGAAARKVLDQNAGATARTLATLRKYLDRDAQGRAPLPHEVK